MFKEKNTLFYHKMMNLCPKYTRKELLKMYVTIIKFEAKELIRLGEKYWKTLPNQWKRPIEDATEHSPKRSAPPKNQKQLMGMFLRRPIPFKEKEIHELSSDEDFFYVKIAKTGKLVVYFHFLILPM